MSTTLPLPFKTSQKVLFLMKISFKNILWEHFIFLNAVSWKYPDFPNTLISDFPLLPSLGQVETSGQYLCCAECPGMSPSCLTWWEALQERDVKCQLRERRFAGNTFHVALAHLMHSEMKVTVSKMYSVLMCILFVGFFFLHKGSQIITLRMTYVILKCICLHIKCNCMLLLCASQVMV